MSGVQRFDWHASGPCGVRDGEWVRYADHEADKAAALAAKDAEIERLRGLLKELEWSGTVLDECNDPASCCPICGEEPDLHDAECQFMAALAPRDAP